jgi:hypothetical protein
LETTIFGSGVVAAPFALHAVLRARNSPILDVRYGYVLRPDVVEVVHDAIHREGAVSLVWRLCESGGGHCEGEKEAEAVHD